MLCRIVVTAIAISYVICVLLLSGLQKEDLDANTLSKLRRHNVNIYDMNNESLRQECLSKSNLDLGQRSKTYETTEDLKDKTKEATKKQNELSTQLTYSSNLNVDTQKSEIIVPESYFVDKANLRNLIDEIKVQGTEDMHHTTKVRMTQSNDMPNKSDNISKVEENRDQQIEYSKNQPSLDTVMNFWAKLAKKDNTKSLRETTTTYRPSTAEETIELITSTTANLSNAQSKDIDYISKMISEYLKSQTVPTTTQISKRRNKDMDIVSRKIKELLERNSNRDFTTTPKHIDNLLVKNFKEITNLAELGKLFQTNNNEEETTEMVLQAPQKVINDNDQIRRSEIMPSNSTFKVSPSGLETKSSKKMQALEYLNNILTVNNKFKLDEPISHASTVDSATKDNNEDRDKKLIVFYQNDTKNTNSAKDKFGTVSADVIKEIAEKVKEIVMRDIRKEIPTTDRPTTCLTTTVSTTTVKQTTPVKEAKDASVIQTLMELLKEFKRKETTIPKTDMPQKDTVNKDKSNFHHRPSDLMYPPVIGGLNPYILKPEVSNIKQLDVDVHPYSPNLVSIPYGSLHHPTLRGPTYMPQTNFYQKIEYQAPAIMIQTNSAEIPPLVIEVSKPMKVMNQHIIVTTQNPFVKMREDKLHHDNEYRYNFKHAKPLHVVDKRNHHLDNPTYADLTKKLQMAENVKQEYRDTNKEKIEKIKERKEHNRDKGTDLRHPIGLEHGIGSSDLAKSTHHQFSPRLDLNHHSGQILSSNHDDKESLNRQHDFNRHESFHRPVEFHHREMLSHHQPGGINHHEKYNRPEDSRYRDVLTQDFLSSLVDSNHRDIISQLVGSRPHERRPMDVEHKSGSHHQTDGYETFKHEPYHPRYKVTKFHEKLEQIETRPQNTYEGEEIKGTTESCYDSVASRQQMPLIKAKEHSKFDDSHFSNFLKSQQKVTDMLERILAAKSKARKESVEMQ